MINNVKTIDKFEYKIERTALIVHCEEVHHERGQDLFRFYHSAHLKDKYMYLFGGKDQNRTSNNQLWRLNLGTRCASKRIIM